MNQSGKQVLSDGRQKTLACLQIKNTKSDNFRNANKVIKKTTGPIPQEGTN